MVQAIQFMNDTELTMFDPYLKYPATYTNPIIPSIFQYEVS